MYWPSKKLNRLYSDKGLKPSIYFVFIHLFVQVMLNAAPSFLNVFHRLVASIMQEGRQRGEADTGNALCAHYDIVNQYREKTDLLEKTVRIRAVV